MFLKQLSAAVASLTLLLGLSCDSRAVEAPTQHLPLIIAHRGGRRWAPENTLAAFKKSIDAHADGIELDIHRCKTGELIVIHDEDVKRTTNGTGWVGDKTLAELKQLDAGSWYKPEFKGEKLPTLEEVFNLVDGKLIVNVEIKNIPANYPGIDDALIEALSHYKYPDKIIVSSFDHQILKSFHKKAPQYQIGLLDAAIPADIGTYAKIVGATAWNPEFDMVRPDAVAAAHAAGLKVNVWTPNDSKDWQHLAGMHVDSIITDDPVGLQSALRSASSVGAGCLPPLHSQGASAETK
jgi:glycerophosphoryl diester phosphodiesterase